MGKWCDDIISFLACRSHEYLGKHNWTNRIVLYFTDVSFDKFCKFVLSYHRTVFVDCLTFFFKY